MAHERHLGAVPLGSRTKASAARWLFSWPLLIGLWAYGYALHRGKDLLLDGDTYWHITSGLWIARHRTVPSTDPFSHTMQGVPWTAHEWLAEILLAAAHEAGGWVLVAAVTALAFAVAIALLTRALLRWLEPIYAIMFAALGVAMTAGHLLARPHILALPLMIVWTVELVRAREENRVPSPWLLPVITVWANLHGGFTLGIALAGALALEALLDSPRGQRIPVMRSWGVFLGLTVAFSLVTPHGPQGILFTWQLLFNHSYALERVGEWRSPNFHTFQPLEIWLLGGLALVLYQGLRLPPVRLLLLVGLLHLALKHIRNAELVGLLAPLFIAPALGRQWMAAGEGKQQLEGLDRFFRRLAQPAGRGALLAGVLTLAAATAVLARLRPIEPPESVAPAAAIQAVRKAGVQGPVLNNYESGGYLIYQGIPAFIDGRNDVYGDQFLREYVEALELRSADSLPRLLDKHGITWTLLTPGNSAVALLDHLPQWRRIHADTSAVVHARVDPEAAPAVPVARK